MDDPLRVHGDALADLDRQTYLLHDHLGLLKSSLVDLPADRAAEVCAALNGLVRAWEGRRRILQRHAPKPPVFEDGSQCTRCSLHEAGLIRERPWPCPDWRDAAGQETPDAD